MGAIDPRPAPQQAQRWTASRAFRTAVVVTLGILAALVVTFALFALVFA
jgi:hypothetical protein